MVSDALQTVEEKMRASVGGLRKELATLRTGRATPALVEHIKVEFHCCLEVIRMDNIGEIHGQQVLP